MDKYAALEQIRQDSMQDELRKIAGETSETAGTWIGGAIGGSSAARALLAGSLMGNPAAGLIGAGALAGATTLPYLLGRALGPRTKNQYEKAEKSGVSSILLPAIGMYRLGRRHATESHGFKKDLIQEIKKNKK